MMPPMTEEEPLEATGTSDESKSGEKAMSDEPPHEATAEQSTEDGSGHRRGFVRWLWNLCKAFVAHLVRRTPTYAVVVATLTLVATFYMGQNQVDIAQKQLEAAQDQTSAAKTQFQLGRQNQASEQYSRALTMLGSSQPNLRISAIDELVDVSTFHIYPEYNYDSDRPYQVGAVKAILNFINMNSPGSLCASPDGSIGFDVEYAVNTFGGADNGQMFKSVIRDVPENQRQNGQDERDPSYVSQHNRIFSKEVTAERPNCWRRISLNRTELPRVSFEGISMPGATFLNSFLGYSVFNGDNLDHLTVNGGSIESAHFDGANLTWSKFEPAEDQFMQPPSIEGATFVNARMCNAKISTDVKNVDFTGARLYGADLRKATNLKQAKWTAIRYDATTLWPEDFRQPEPPTDGPPNCA